MTIEDLYKFLNTDEALDGYKHRLHAHLTRQLERQKENPEQSREIAYETAGLMSTDTVQSLDTDDPYLEVLEIMGQLELPEEERSSDVNWEELRKKVNNLP